MRVSKTRKRAMSETRGKVSAEEFAEDLKAGQRRSYHEDEGMYDHICYKCNKHFLGDKARYICRECMDRYEKINY